MEEILKNILDKANIEVSPEDEGKYDNLNLLPVNILNQAKALNFHRHALAYLSYVTTERNHKYLNNFVASIIFGDETIDNWGYQPYLFPDTSLRDQLTKSLQEIFRNLQNDFSAVISPSYSSWIAGSSQVGTPLVSTPDADYTYHAPQGFIGISAEYDIKFLNNEHDKVIAFRRWIAQRIANYLKSKKVLQSFTDPDVLIDIAPYSVWTNEAQSAFKGLLRERNELGWKEGEIPGFVGPDEFYL